MGITKNDLIYDNIIILKSVYDKVSSMVYYILPVKDPKTGQFPPCVRTVNAAGDMILSDKDRADMTAGKVALFAEDHVFEVRSGQKFDLTNIYDAAEWECIKNSRLIAKDRNERDSKGNLVIDGVKATKNNPGRNGTAELYIDRPGLETARKVSKAKLRNQAENFILNDEKGVDGQLNMALILGKDMSGQPAADVIDFLIRVADKDPQKIINLYTGGDTNLRLLFIQAKKKHVIYVKNKIYLYGDSIILGATDDAVIAWMKNPHNKKTLELIQRDTFPDLFPTE